LDLLTLLCTVPLNYKQHSAISDLHTFQFTAAHALRFSVSTSRCLVADLNKELSLQITMKSSCRFFFNHLGMPMQLSGSNSPVSVLRGTNLYSTNLCDSPRPIYDWLIPFYDSRYIDAARTCITENTCHVIATHCCDVTVRARCIATVRARTQRKHFHRTVAWRVCWRVFIGPLLSNALSKSVTLCKI
jgi:hypothetical protein